ncbi:High-affinity branched-chain amino acid transport ATP-binding protein LivF [compost metagenome]
MTNPQLLLLDEPMEGLAPIIVEELAEAIRQMCAQEGLASVVVEQHPVLTLAMTDEVIVLERGKVIHQGTSQALAADPALLDRMLGVTLAV